MAEQAPQPVALLPVAALLVAPGVPVPLAVVLLTFDSLIGVVTVVRATVGATVSLVVVFVLVEVFPAVSVTVAV